ncbi:MAG: hypothetical protein KAT48_13745 [Bacteroidales bacterium]|nr:hypothetical protein [Bacteroidales bacterium]
MPTKISIIVVLCSFILSSVNTLAQKEWKLVKDKNEIKIFTRSIEGTKLKAYKGEAMISVNIEQLYNFLINVGNYHEWAYECKESTLISKVDDIEYIYYSIYKMPWPFYDRDIVTKMDISSRNGEEYIIILETKLIEGIREEKKNLVRIPEYYQKTTLIKQDNISVKMIIEGYLDPGGKIPIWIINMFLADGPYESIINIKEILEQ